MRISIVTLGVKDLARSSAFYEALGLVRRPGPDSISFFELDGSWLSLYPISALAEDAQVGSVPVLDGRPKATLAYIVGSKAEVDAFMARAENAGATVEVPPEEKFWGGYSGYFSDIDGHFWEIAWNPEFSGS